jgi:hypothetical protein
MWLLRHFAEQVVEMRGEEFWREGEERYLSVLASARSGEGEGVEVGSRGEERREETVGVSAAE